MGSRGSPPLSCLKPQPRGRDGDHPGLLPSHPHPIPFPPPPRAVSLHPLEPAQPHHQTPESPRAAGMPGRRPGAACGLGAGRGGAACTAPQQDQATGPSALTLPGTCIPKQGTQGIPPHSTEPHEVFPHFYYKTSFFLAFSHLCSLKPHSPTAPALPGATPPSPVSPLKQSNRGPVFTGTAVGPQQLPSPLPQPPCAPQLGTAAP